MFSKKVTAAVVVLYHPDSTALRYIETYRDFVKFLYVIDNTENVTSTILTSLLKHDNVKLLHKGENLGMAKALNLALVVAQKDNIRWLMTMDQDTYFKTHEFTVFFDALQTITDPTVCLYAPLHNPKFIIKEQPLVEKRFVMTSANMINVSIIQSLGGFDENLFIDEVDHELCFRARAHGYKILLNQSIAVEHTLGTKDTKKVGLTCYPPERLYYMTRNYLYLRKRYRDVEQDFFYKRDRYMVKFLFQNILYGQLHLENIKMIIRGLRDYRQQHFGKL